MNFSNVKFHNTIQMIWFLVSILQKTVRVLFGMVKCRFHLTSALGFYTIIFISLSGFLAWIVHPRNFNTVIVKCWRHDIADDRVKYVRKLQRDKNF